jgi:predicted nucleotidyltransferase
MMESKMVESENVLRRVTETLEKKSSVLVAVVYGSAATGTMQNGSDVDVAVLCTEPLRTEEKLSLISELTASIGREVDLVDLRLTNGVLLKQILTKGKVVIKKDAAAYAELIKKMIYNQEDYMPYYHRALRERMERFVSGQGAG